MDRKAEQAVGASQMLCGGTEQQALGPLCLQ